MQRLLLLFIVTLVFISGVAVAANYKGSVSSYDLKAGTVTIAQGSLFNTFRFRPDVEITLNGLAAKLDQIPVGATVTIVTSEPQVASKIVASAAAAAGAGAGKTDDLSPGKVAEPDTGKAAAPVSGKVSAAAALDPEVEQFSRALAEIQNAELSVNGRRIRSLDELQKAARTSTVADLKKECLASTDRILAALEKAPAKRLGATFAYLKTALLRIKENGGEKWFQSHVDWARDNPTKILDETKKQADEVEKALGK